VLIETRVGRLYVEERGEGDPVILWHSLLCDGGMWRFQLPALAARYRAINIDGPGHGRSAPIRRAFTLEDCAEAGCEVMDALGVDKAHWIGLSWGGMTGMRLALARPERIRSLALLDTSADPESRRKLPAYRAMELVAKTLGAGTPILRPRMEKIFFAKRTRENHPQFIDDFFDHAARMDAASIPFALDAVIFERKTITDRIAKISAPSIVMVGNEDRATPPERSRTIAARIPGAELVEIPDAGHLSALEQPDLVNRRLLDFLARA
jgi:3-oxoadipate enol-lactonase